MTCRGIVSPGSEACTALYVDGKLVDLEEYRDEYEAWLKVAEEEGIRSANEGEGLKGMYNHYYRDKNWNQMKFRREN